MKKILFRVILVVVVLVVVVIVALGLSLDGVIKRGVETVGSKLTKVDVKLDKVGLSLLSGSGSISGLVVGNPDGYKTPHAISVGSATLALKPSSLLSDKIVITKIEVAAPEIIFEGGLTGNNLGRILSNLKESSGGSSSATDTNAPANPLESKPGKKLEVDTFDITGAKVQLSVNGLTDAPKVVTIPDIHLSDLGTGTDGITPAELTKVVLQKIEEAAVTAAGSSSIKDLEKTGADKITKGLGDLLNKK